MGFTKIVAPISIAGAIGLAFIVQPLASQNIDREVHAADCKDARLIKAAGNISFREPLSGFGIDKEIAGGSNSSHYFEEEHNVGWFRFEAAASGFLSFLIVPTSMAADFDFVLFKTDTNSACEQMKQRGLLPIRSNLARNDSLIGTRTGLSPAADSDYKKAGKNNCFSNLLEVEKGEHFYLALDDVYGSQKGFLIKFNYYKQIGIDGTVSSEKDGTPVEARITLEEPSTGFVLGETKSNKQGEYHLDTYAHKSKTRAAVLAAEPLTGNLVYSEERVNGLVLEERKFQFGFRVRKLEKDMMLMATDINFRGNEAIPVSNSVPTLERMKRLVKRHETLAIALVGHVNDPWGKQICLDGFHQSLSENRAIFVKSYLMESGVEENRMTTYGLSCHQMLFPNATSDHEHEMNRRVEIKVLHE